MENRIIIAKLMILFFIAGRLFEKLPPHSAFIFLILLVSISLTMAFYISRKKSFKQVWLWLPRSLWLEYGLCASLSFLIYGMALEATRRIKKLTGENDRLHQTAHRLTCRIQQGSEWERQLRYLSQLEERNKSPRKSTIKSGISFPAASCNWKPPPYTLTGIKTKPEPFFRESFPF